jgi:hypothetical protein
MNTPDRPDESASLSMSNAEPLISVGGLQELEGQFAFMTTPKDNFLTAVGGGGRTTDVIHTDATIPRSWEMFRLWSTNVSGFYGIQTVNGHFVTAVAAGGRTTDTIHTDATVVASWELFAPVPLSYPQSGFGLKTIRGFFLTAVGGGGHNSGDTIHTDATVAKGWESFLPYRAGHFGTGSTYGIQIWGGNASDEQNLRGWMFVNVGGGDPGPGALWLTEEGEVNEISWTLLKQADGTYALQTANGTVLSAIDGGAPGAGFRSDIPVSAIGNNEKFTLIDNGDMTVWIKTFVGTYISLGSGVVAGVSNISRALKFRLQLFNLAPGPTG